MTGAWTGATAGALLRIPKERGIPAVFLGVLIAAAVVTPVALAVIHHREIPGILRHFIKIVGM